MVTRLDASPGLTRRRWSASAKARIVAETLVSGANVSAIAREHGLSAQLLFAWRRRARSGRRGEGAAPMPFAVVEVETSDGGIVEVVVSDVLIRVGPQVSGLRLKEILAAVRER